MKKNKSKRKQTWHQQWMQNLHFLSLSYLIISFQKGDFLGSYSSSMYNLIVLLLKFFKFITNYILAKFIKCVLGSALTYLNAGYGVSVCQFSADSDVAPVVGNDEHSTPLPFCVLILSGYCDNTEITKISQCNPTKKSFSIIWSKPHPLSA